MIIQKQGNPVRDVKRRARSGVAVTVIATVLSSCAATMPEDESLVATRVAGPPLSLLRKAVAGRFASEPLQLVLQDRTDWVVEIAEPSVAGNGASGDAARIDGRPDEVAIQLHLPPVNQSVSDDNLEHQSTGRPRKDTGSPDDIVVAERPVEMPLVLLNSDRPVWLPELEDDPTVAARAVGDPPRLLASSRPDRLLVGHVEPIVAERAVGEPLQLVNRDGPDWLKGWHDGPPTVAETPPHPSVPLVLTDGSYHWLEPAGLAEPPCQVSGNARTSGSHCPAADDQIALADSVVDDSDLSEMRGGFITAGGYQIDFGYYVETLVNGVTELTSALTLNDMLAGETAGGVPTVGSVTLSGTGDTSTLIQHSLSAEEIRATIANTQSNIDLNTTATLAIDVIDLRQVQIGTAFGAMRRMPIEVQQSIIRGMSR